jgi:4-hydroxy-2-oxoheptanedioate aldolase
VAELASQSGFDCVWADLEHVANDYSTIESQILAAKCHDVDMLVRVPRGSYSDYIRPLEMDATGIMVPHVMSLAEAKQVVSMTRFAPLGRRSVDSGNADGAYGHVPFLEYFRDANEQRFVVLQIEDPEPLEEIDAIAALEGYDMLFFGPSDFSVAIGVPGQWDHPRIADARRRLAGSARKYGKSAGTVGSPKNLADLVALGYRFVSLGADVVGLGSYCLGLMEAASSIVNALKSKSPSAG